MYGYSLLVVGMDLRYNAVTSVPDTYDISCSTILEALRIAMESCRRVEPQEMAEVLRDAVVNEWELIHHGG
jgi:hypothetical protein